MLRHRKPPVFVLLQIIVEQQSLRRVVCAKSGSDGQCPQHPRGGPRTLRVRVEVRQDPQKGLTRWRGARRSRKCERSIGSHLSAGLLIILDRAGTIGLMVDLIKEVPIAEKDKRIIVVS